MDAQTAVLLTLVGLCAGFVNSLAGGGTLIAYPALLAAGLPPVGANITALFGLLSGYVGAIHGYKREIREQARVSRLLAVPAFAGGLVGALLLLVTPSDLFERIIPFLVLAATILLYIQGRPTMLARRDSSTSGRATFAVTCGLVFIAGVYGAYFSAGLGVLLLALLGFRLPLGIQHLNALKSVFSLVIVVAAVIVYATSGLVHWLFALVLLPSSALGGYLGARFARVLSPEVLRVGICTLGLVLAILLFANAFGN